MISWMTVLLDRRGKSRTARRRRPGSPLSRFMVCDEVFATGARNSHQSREPLGSRYSDSACVSGRFRPDASPLAFTRDRSPGLALPASTEDFVAETVRFSSFHPERGGGL
jgi:hypothetical protein